MTSKTTRNLIAALMVATAGIALGTPAMAASAPRLSSSVSTQLQAAQTDVTAKKFPEALAAVQKAQGLSDLSNYDKLKINQFLMFININMGNQAAAADAAEAAADTPDIPDAEKNEVITNGAILALNAKHYDKALRYAKAMQAMNLTDAKSQQIIGQALFLGGDYAAAKDFTQKQIDAEVAAGKKPDHNQLEIILSAQAKAKDEAGAEATLETLVATYGDPHDWQQIIDISLSSKGLRDIDAIYLGRLLFAGGWPVSQQNANLIGSTASHLTFFGDAATAAKNGGTGFPDNNARAEADKKSMPQQITAGQKQNGQYNVKLAEALYSYGMYPEAEAAARLAQSKGGISDPSEPAMVIGMSLVQQGKYNDAITAFQQVQGGGPATARIVRLWVDYAKLKANPPVADTAAAAPAK